MLCPTAYQKLCTLYWYASDMAPIGSFVTGGTVEPFLTIQHEEIQQVFVCNLTYP